VGPATATVADAAGVAGAGGRTLLSTFTVNNPTDTPVAGETDLRQAIGLANAATSASTIDFNITMPATVTLSNGVLELSNFYPMKASDRLDQGVLRTKQDLSSRKAPR
jgi:hypothetical protein